MIVSSALGSAERAAPSQANRKTHRFSSYQIGCPESSSFAEEMLSSAGKPLLHNTFGGFSSPVLPGPGQRNSPQARISTCLPHASIAQYLCTATGTVWRLIAGPWPAPPHPRSRKRWLRCDVGVARPCTASVVDRSTTLCSGYVFATFQGLQPALNPHLAIFGIGAVSA